MTADQSIDVLLIEDNPADARLVREYIADIDEEGLFDRMRGWRDIAAMVVTHASDITSGTDHLNEGEFDVVLLDLQLPDSDGIESVETVTSTAPTVPVIVLTGMPEQQLGIEAVARGAQDYLPKDELEPRILLKTIQYAIERKEQSRELRQRSDQLAILTRLMRHDVRNDVSLIVGRAKELTDYVNPQGQGPLEEIIQSGNHVLQLTQTIGEALDEITTTDDQELAAVPLRPIVEKEVEQASSLYRGADITVGEIPDVDVRADRLLASVVTNLINNGVFYNDKDVPHVRVDAAIQDGTVLLRVADNGPGIPAVQREKLFDEGFEKNEPTGLGIGLTLAYRFVDQYDGSITIEPNEPEGSIFIVELKRA